MPLSGKAGGPGLGYMERAPLEGPEEKQRFGECPGREALCGEVREREEPSLAAMRRGPQIQARRKEGQERWGKCHLCLFFPLNKLNKAAAPGGPSGRPVISWGDMRPPKHCSRFPAWPPLPDQRHGRFVRGAWRSSHMGLCFSRGRFLTSVAWEVASFSGAWRKSRTNYPKTSLTLRMQLGWTQGGTMWLRVLLTLLLCEFSLSSHIT